MARPQTMTELKKPDPKKGLLGKYRTMYHGAYRWYRARSKQDAMQMHLLEVAKEKETANTFEAVKQRLIERGFEIVVEIVESLATDQPEILEDEDWSDLEELVGSQSHMAPHELAHLFAQNRLSAWITKQKKHRPKDDPQAKTVGQAVKEFLKRQFAKTKGGEISAGRYDNLRRMVNHFTKFCSPQSGVQILVSNVLEDYHSYLMTEHDTWSGPYKNGYMDVARQFIKWCFRAHIIDNYPRNLDDQELVFKIVPKTVRFFTNEEIKVLLEHANERMKLNLLLMLNCGMTQVDISDLAPDEVDWKQHTITRKRSKTESNESVPTVTYPLWNETWKLFAKYGKKSGDRVFLNRNGKPLKNEELQEKGGETDHFSKSDNLGVNFGRLRRKLAKKGLLKTNKSLKVFRKTSNSVLKNSPYAHYAVHFLGQSPRGVNETNYTAVFQGSFADAVKWLGTYYGIEPGESLPSKSP